MGCAGPPQLRTELRLLAHRQRHGDQPSTVALLTKAHGLLTSPGRRRASRHPDGLHPPLRPTQTRSVISIAPLLAPSPAPGRIGRAAADVQGTVLTDDLTVRLAGVLGVRLAGVLADEDFQLDMRVVESTTPLVTMMYSTSCGSTDGGACRRRGAVVAVRIHEQVAGQAPARNRRSTVSASVRSGTDPPATASFASTASVHADAAQNASVSSGVQARVLARM